MAKKRAPSVAPSPAPEPLDVETAPVAEAVAMPAVLESVDLAPAKFAIPAPPPPPPLTVGSLVTADGELVGGIDSLDANGLTFVLQPLFRVTGGALSPASGPSAALRSGCRLADFRRYAN